MAKIGKIIPLPAETRANLGYDFIYRIGYADIATLTSGTGQAIIPLNDLAGSSTTFPAGSVVEKIVPNVVTAVAASAGTLTTLTFSVGDGGSATRFVNAQDAMTAAWGTAYTSKYAYASADTLDLKFTLNTNSTAVISTVATLSAGQIDLYVKLADLSTLPNIVLPG